RHIVMVRNASVQLPLKEFELLEVLLRNSGRVLTRMQLIDRVWGADYVGDTKTLDVHIKRLRAKVEQDPARPMHIITVRGLGYKFEPGGWQQALVSRPAARLRGVLVRASLSATASPRRACPWPPRPSGSRPSAESATRLAVVRMSCSSRPSAAPGRSAARTLP